MVSRLGLSGLALSLFVLSAAHAAASPVTWQFTGVFADGGTASGSFVFNAGLDMYSAVNITTTTGSSFVGTTDLTVESQFSDTATSTHFAPAVLADYTNSQVLYLVFSSALTNAGGTIAINTANSAEERCSAANCNGNNSVLRYFTSGSVTTTTPEPSSIMMAGLGLAALAAWRQRANRRA
jgi:MYXO-CTERM domain-containing protein